MNTDDLLTFREIEELETAFRCVRRSALKDRISWSDFVITYCNLHGLKYTNVVSDETLLERLNILWLRSFRRPIT